MRAACEVCAAPQPPDWQPGHFCTSCGSPTRRETRCAWCVAWTPDGAHCRRCGTDLVDEALFPAARMLVAGGTDRFSIASVLAGFDASRVEDLTRAYQSHAAVLAAHIDLLAVVEQRLVVRGLAARLEDEQLPLLPWPDDVLRRYSTALADEVDSADVDAIRRSTPFELTRQAAAVALVATGDTAHAVDAIAALHAPATETLRWEAALALTGWRARTTLLRGDLAWPDAEIDAALRAAAADGRVSARAAVHLSGSSRTTDVDALRALAHRPGLDAETTFDIALQLADTDVLRTAVHDRSAEPLATIAAARVLVRIGHLDELEDALRHGPHEVVDEVVAELDLRRSVAPRLEDVLVTIALDDTRPRTAQRATRVVSRSASDAAVRRIARARLDDPAVVQALLQGSGVSAEAVRDVADLLLAAGRCSIQQFGIQTVAEDGRLDDRWVPQRFADASPGARVELLKLAEVQLGARHDADLHRFVLDVVFGDVESEVRVAGLWALRRWYRADGDHRGEGPLALTRSALALVPWTIDQAVRGLVHLIRDDAALRDVGVFEWTASLLRSADDEFVTAVATPWHGSTDPSGLAHALATLAESDHWSILVSEANALHTRLLGRATESAPRASDT